MEYRSMLRTLYQSETGLSTVWASNDGTIWGSPKYVEWLEHRLEDMERREANLRLETRDERDEMINIIAGYFRHAGNNMQIRGLNLRAEALLDRILGGGQ